MIQIIDGFKLNASTPIDSRFVVADDTERTNITYLYHGLRVWQKNTNTPWFYDGTQWVSELDLVVTGSGTVNSIPKVTSSSPLVVGDSQISDDGTIVNITNDLTVGNNITFSGSLNGTIDANNITTGILSLNRLETGTTNGQVLQMSGGVPSWVNLNTLSIGTSDSSNTVKINNTNSSGSYRLVLCDGSIGSSKQLYSNNNGIKVREASGELRILAHDGAVDRPPYSFDNSDKTGIYSPGSNQIGLSVDGLEIARFASTFTTFRSGGSEKARFTNSIIQFRDNTQFSFTDINDRLYIYDSSSKGAEKSSLKIQQPNATKNSIAIDMLFNSGSNKKRMIMSPYVSNGGYSSHSNENDSIIKVDNPNGVLLLSAVKNSSSSAKWDSIRIWEGKLQIGANNKGSENYSVHIKQNGTDYSLVVDDTFFVKPGEIKMLRKTYERKQVFIGTGLTTYQKRWVGNTYGDIDANTSAVNIDSVDYDRIISFTPELPNGDAKIRRCEMYVENGVSSDIFKLLSSFYMSSSTIEREKYNTATIFVPAGCRWRCSISGIKDSGGPLAQGYITIQSFGIQ